jgi:hypothetical protein
VTTAIFIVLEHLIACNAAGAVGAAAALAASAAAATVAPNAAKVDVLFMYALLERGRESLFRYRVGTLAADRC